MEDSSAHGRAPSKKFSKKVGAEYGEGILKSAFDIYSTPRDYPVKKVHCYRDKEETPYECLYDINIKKKLATVFPNKVVAIMDFRNWHFLPENDKQVFMLYKPIFINAVYLNYDDIKDITPKLSIKLGEKPVGDFVHIFMYN